MSVSVLEEMVLSQAAMQKVSKSNLHVMQGSYYFYSFTPGCHVNLLDFYLEYMA